MSYPSLWKVQIGVWLLFQFFWFFSFLFFLFLFRCAKWWGGWKHVRRMKVRNIQTFEREEKKEQDTKKRKDEEVNKESSHFLRNSYFLFDQQVVGKIQKFISFIFVNFHFNYHAFCCLNDWMLILFVIIIFIVFGNPMWTNSTHHVDIADGQ